MKLSTVQERLFERKKKITTTTAQNKNRKQRIEASEKKTFKTTESFRLPNDSRKRNENWKNEKKRSRSARARIHIVVIDIVEVVVGKINFYVIRKGNKSVYNKEYTTKISNEPNHTHTRMHIPY